MTHDMWHAVVVEHSHKQGQGNQCQTPGDKFEELT